MPLDPKTSRNGKKWLALAINTRFLIDPKALVGKFLTLAKSGWREKAKTELSKSFTFFITIHHAGVMQAAPLVMQPQWWVAGTEQ
jgi:hypothetical protein